MQNTSTNRQVLLRSSFLFFCRGKSLKILSECVKLMNTLFWLSAAKFL